MVNLISSVYSHRRLCLLLYCLGNALVVCTVASFVVSLVVFAIDSLWGAVGFVAITAVPFALVSFFRRAFNAPRPAEVYSFDETFVYANRKRGRSFPSRHVFSAFVIGTALCFLAPVFGILICTFGLVLGVCRALLGIHFVRDVVAGALIGICSGIIGHLIVNIGLLPLVIK